MLQQMKNQMPVKLKELLIEQIYSTVKWRESIIYMSKKV